MSLTKATPRVIEGSVWTFDNVAAMKASTRIRVGDTVHTKAYATPGDSGEGTYTIVAASTGTDDGGGYIDLAGSGLQAKLSQSGYFCPMQWGAVGDGETDDRDAIVAMLDWGAAIADDPRLDTAEKTYFPAPMTYHGKNKIYGIGSEISLAQKHTLSLFQNMTFKAIDSGNWETAGGTATTERESYRPQKSDYFFRCGANATFVKFYNCTFDCANLCGGVKLAARGRFIDCLVTHCAGIGVEGGAGDVWVDNCQIGQWLSNEVEWYDHTAYTGIGCFSEDSDMRITNSVIRWLHELVRFEGTNHHVWGGHLFNGCNGYLASDRGGDATLEAAMAVYFDGTNGKDTVASSAAASTHDFTVRSYNAGIVTAGSPASDCSFNGIYFDNCHNEHYTDRVVYTNPKLGFKNGSTISGMRDYWFRFWCHTDGATPSFRIFDIQILVKTGAKSNMFEFSPYNGNSWLINYNAFESSAVNAVSTAAADGLSMFYPVTYIVPNGQGQGPAIRFYSPSQGSGVGMADHSTSLDGEDLPLWAIVQANGDNLQVRMNNDFVVKSQDNSTEHMRLTADGAITFRQLNAEPTSANYSIAMSDGTSSTNGFGTSGAGLYAKIADAWTKL